MGKSIPLSKQVGSLARQAKRRSDKMTLLDSADAGDARRTKKDMVDVPHKYGASSLGEAWRPGAKWKGANGKTKRRHTPMPSK